MALNEAFTATEAYIREQEQEMRSLTEEEIPQFVIASLHTLASEHFNPLVHRVSQDIPSLDNTGWLSIELINAARNRWVNPSLEGKLPARVHESTAESTADYLLLPMDGGPIKIQAYNRLTPSQTFVRMAIIRYGRFNSTEAADFRAGRAALGDVIDSKAPIFAPLQSAEYDYRSSFGANCKVESLRNTSEDVWVYWSDMDKPSPQEFSLLHGIFMRQTRMALAALAEL